MPLSAQEQYLLELTNRARLDPLAEAARYGIDLNQGLAAGTITATPKQALAANELLNTSSEFHSEWMLDTDTFSHTGAGGSNAGERMADAGYVFSGAWSWAENLAWWGTTGGLNLTTAIDTHHEGLFKSSGHRVNTLADSFREVGIAQVSGTFTVQSTNYNSSMTTLNFARSGTSMFVTGVAYTDLDGDNFYSVGEGRNGVAFRISGADIATQAVTTSVAGGYAVAAPQGAGDATVTITHGANTSVVEVTRSNGNVKLDLVGDTTLLASGDVTLVSGPINRLVALGAVAVDLTGNASANRLEGNAAVNALNGMAGNDSITGGGGNDTLWGDSGNDSLWGGTGNDLVYGGFGNDRLHGDDGNDTMDAGHGNDQLFGSNGNDVMRGQVGTDLLRGGAGNDQLYGGSDADTVEGNSGDDRLWGDAGNDVLRGHVGQDTLYGGADNDQLYGGDWADRLYGDDGNDSLWGGTSNDWLYGGAGNDLAYGDGGNDRVHGESGNDSLYGGDGNDQLFGGTGTDRLFGGNGNDRLDGSQGNDTLTGGAGADRFVFKLGSGADTVADFSRAQGDKILLDDALFAPGTTLAQAAAAFVVNGDGATLSINGGSLFIDGFGAVQASDLAWV